MGWQSAPAVNNPAAASTAAGGWAAAPAADAPAATAPAATTPPPLPPPAPDARFTDEEKARILAFAKTAKTPQELERFAADIGRDRGISIGNAHDVIAHRAHEGVSRTFLDQPVTAAQDSRPTSFWQGVGEGVEKPWNKAAQGLEWLLPRALSGMSGAPVEEINASQQWLSRQLGMPGTVQEAENNQQEARARSPNQGSGLGQFTGEVVGTLPTLELPGGVLTQGAAAGGLLSDAGTPLGFATDMAIGAIGSKVGQKLIHGVGSVVAPRLSGPLKALVDAGVRVTPGQALRASSLGSGKVVSTLAGGLAAVEDKATSLPVVGDMINADRAATSEQFVRGAVRKVMGALGQTLPDDLPAGHAMVLHAKQALKVAYTNALGRMQMVPDHQLMQEVNDLGQRLAAGELDEPHTKRFEQVVRNIVQRRMGPQGMTGENLKATISELGNKAANMKGSSVGAEREYGAALMELAGMIKSAAVRSSPAEAVADLRAADTAYAHYVRIRGAAKGATGGVFTPGQLEVAVRTADSSVGKGDTATGQALMQDYATAGRRVLPSKVADSGTAGRKANLNPIAWGVGAGMSIPYGLAKLGTAAVARNPGPAATAAGRAIQRATPTLGIAAPAAIAQTRQ